MVITKERLLSITIGSLTFLITSLEKYNFTIDENTSASSEIAIDPEMLGRIFENLLAEQNPETQESARKATGSYYTPREIVDYMVEQSLIEFIKSNIRHECRSQRSEGGVKESSISKNRRFRPHRRIPETLRAIFKRNI